MKRETVRAILASAALGALIMAPPAFAVLGGAPTYPATASGSQITQRAASAVASGASAGASASSAASYTVQQTTLDTGTVVREYIAGGAVFAIAWEGPQLPDLRKLLGSYFPQYVSDLETQRGTVGGHGPARVQQGGLVVHSGGHMGDFSGHAFLPQSLPPGVTESDIR
jgi:hypothetical protein